MSELSGIKGNWDVIKAKTKQRYGILIDSDLAWVEGKHDEMLAKLNLKLGIPKDELHGFFVSHEHSTI